MISIIHDRNDPLTKFVATSAFRYANTVFDGFKVWKAGAVCTAVRPMAHVERLLASAQRAGLDTDDTADALREAVTTLSERWVDGAHFVRMFVCGDGGVLQGKQTARTFVFALRAEDLQPSQAPAVPTLRFSFDSVYPGGFVKTPANYMLCAQIARQRGGELSPEALLLDADGYVTECTRCAIFFVRQGTAIFPRLRTSMLDSITRRIAHDLLEADARRQVVTRDVSLSELASFDAAYLCSSSFGICPVSRIDDKTFVDPADASWLQAAYLAQRTPF